MVVILNCFFCVPCVCIPFVYTHRFQPTTNNHQQPTNQPNNPPKNNNTGPCALVQHTQTHSTRLVALTSGSEVKRKTALTSSSSSQMHSHSSLSSHHHSSSSLSSSQSSSTSSSTSSSLSSSLSSTSTTTNNIPLPIMQPATATLIKIEDCSSKISNNSHLTHNPYQQQFVAPHPMHQLPPLHHLQPQQHNHHHQTNQSLNLNCSTTGMQQQQQHTSTSSSTTSTSNDSLNGISNAPTDLSTAAASHQLFYQADGNLIHISGHNGGTMLDLSCGTQLQQQHQQPRSVSAVSGGLPTLTLSRCLMPAATVIEHQQPPEDSNSNVCSIPTTMGSVPEGNLFRTLTKQMSLTRSLFVCIQFKMQTFRRTHRL